MGAIFEPSSLREYRQRQVSKGSKLWYHSSTSPQLPKQLHVQWHTQHLVKLPSTYALRKPVSYNPYLIQLGLSCCFAWGYLVISGMSQINARSERLLQNKANSKKDENNSPVSMEDIRRIQQRQTMLNDIDNLLHDGDDEKEFISQKSSISQVNFQPDIPFWRKFGSGQFSNQAGSSLLMMKNSYHNMVQFQASQGVQKTVFLYPSTVQVNLNKNESEVVPKSLANIQYRLRQQKKQAPKPQHTTYYGMWDRLHPITENWATNQFQLSSREKSTLVQQISSFVNITRQQLMDTIKVLKVSLQLNSYEDALGVIIRHPQLLHLNQLVMKYRLKYWIVDQQLSPVLIAKHPACLEFSGIEVDNTIDWLWRKGVNNGALVIIVNSKLNWSNRYEIQQIFQKLEKIFGLRYLAAILNHAPWVLSFDHDLLSKNLEWLKRIKFSDEQIVQFFKGANGDILARSMENKTEKYQALLSFGLSGQEAVQVLAQNPSVLLKDVNGKTQRSKLDYCVQYFGCSEVELIKACPHIFGYSLESKIRPRLAFLKCLKIDCQLVDLNRYLVNVNQEEFATLCGVGIAEYKQYQENQ
eukprot:TRINITY_DN4439_c0_g1_i1.p1 TRINITY_DN4439_c0_g1~~TRINITY_DN4439_c0_g1_i1.p1  ORF type:complete len:582 (-),score=41.74 TRINITY_DN4439_c0_g1_i1:301-2046(-)